MRYCPKCGKWRFIEQKDRLICDECGWVGKYEETLAQPRKKLAKQA